MENFQLMQANKKILISINFLLSLAGCGTRSTFTPWSGAINESLSGHTIQVHSTTHEIYDEDTVLAQSQNWGSSYQYRYAYDKQSNFGFGISFGRSHFDYQWQKDFKSIKISVNPRIIIPTFDIDLLFSISWIGVGGSILKEITSDFYIYGATFFYFQASQGIAKTQSAIHLGAAYHHLLTWGFEYQYQSIYTKRVIQRDRYEQFTLYSSFNID